MDATKKLFASNVPVEVTIIEVLDHAQIETLAGKVIYNGKFELKYDAKTRINFPAPIFIRPGVGYKIQFDLTQSVRSTLSQKSEVQIEDDINIKFHSDSNPDRNEVELLEE